MRKKIHGELKQLFQSGNFLRSKRLYIAAAACIGIFALSIAIMLSVTRQQSVDTNGGQTNGQDLVALPTPDSLSTIRLPRSTATPVPPKPTPQRQQPAPEPAADAVAVAKKNTPPKLSMPVVGDVMNPFSIDELVKSKTTGNWTVHKGVDIKCDLSTAVLAAADGVVEQAYADDLMGNTIVLAHDGEYKTIYSNLATLDMVAIGEKVKKGQAISGVGDTALLEVLEEAHLHFALTTNAGYQNPMDYMAN